MGAGIVELTGLADDDGAGADDHNFVDVVSFGHVKPPFVSCVQMHSPNYSINFLGEYIEIKKNVPLPIIGIIKRDYPDSHVYITPTLAEVDELMPAKPEIIALDATLRPRPGNLSLEQLYYQIREKYPQQLLMADCSTIKEALAADKLGFDFIGTTLVGYTEESQGAKIEHNDFEIIRRILKEVSHPVIAEGNIDTPEKARRVIDLGCYSVVVGSIITRPQLITKRFTEALAKLPQK